MALSNKGKYIVAAARNGAIPAPKMAALVENYTGEKLNYNIPTSRKFNAAETKYWKDFLKNLILKYIEETNSINAKKIFDSFDKEIKNFYQICPKEMVDKLDNPISLKKNILRTG